jgi:TRAP transporter TAXI family solute receptor
MFGHLASGGLTWDDVKVVPVPAVNDGADALVQGRADVTEHALGAAKVKEADAAVGVRHVSIDCSPEGERRLRQAVPGYYPRIVKAGTATAVVEDTCFIAYDIYLSAGKNVPDAVVEAALKAVWENVDKLPPLHPIFREWTRERAVTADVTIPYHPGAIRFYKERGVWKPEMDQVQQKLLSLNP